ncbi:MAG TPA: excinuclease ABC subunit UvrC [Myxococcota bacterium]
MDPSVPSTTDRLAERVAALPTGPGVYLWKNARGRVLYVGKAQNLRSRARSYLREGGDGRVRMPAMIAQAADVEVVVTPSVKDALLLENELIKRHKPPFNVRLRDDKQYLGLRLDPRERWPRLVPVRRFRADGASYFGPYTSSQALREAISNLRRIFPLRSCSDPVFRDYARRGRPCIEFEMKRCLGPCVGLVDEATYAELVAGTALFLRGRSEQLLGDLRARMAEAAEAERFEEAARLRDRIAAVEKTLARQQIVSERGEDRDVFGVARRGGELEVHGLHVRGGRVAGHDAWSFSGVEQDDAEALGSFLGQYYGAPDRAPAREVLVPFEPDDAAALAELLAERAGRRVPVRVPRRGPAAELVAMANENAALRLAQRLEARESVAAAAAELQERLGLARPPRRIECYDVSTLAGTLAVASRVVFEDGRPDKAAWRRYRIREAAAGDDLACLREVMTRRLARRESEPLPDLLLVDGGRGQVAVVAAALRDAGAACDVVGISKERDEAGPASVPGDAASARRAPRVRRSGGLKAERLHLPGRKDPVLLPPASQGLLLLQRVRDEAHRFAIEFQRRLRQRANLSSILQEIPGIGPGKRRALLRELGSLRAVREAPVERLAAVSGVGEADARRIRAFFDDLERLPAQ